MNQCAAAAAAAAAPPPLQSYIEKGGGLPAPILGPIPSDEMERDLRFDKLLLLTDPDADGIHIAGLVILAIASRHPGLLFNRGYMHIMRVPLYGAGGNTHKGLSSLTHDGVRRVFFNFDLYVREFIALDELNVRNLWRAFHKDYARWRRWLLVAPGPAAAAPIEVVDPAGGFIPGVARRVDVQARLALIRVEPPRTRANTRQLLAAAAVANAAALVEVHPRTGLHSVAKATTYTAFVTREYRTYAIHAVRRHIPRLIRGVSRAGWAALKWAWRHAPSDANGWPKQHVTEQQTELIGAAVYSATPKYVESAENITDVVQRMGATMVGSLNLRLFTVVGATRTRRSAANDAPAGRYVKVILRPDLLEAISLGVVRNADRTPARLLERPAGARPPRDGPETIAARTQRLRRGPDIWPPPPIANRTAAHPVFILPLALINGVNALAPGWRSIVPAHRPSEIARVLLMRLERRVGWEAAFPPPGYVQFKGRIREAAPGARLADVAAPADGDDSEAEDEDVAGDAPPVEAGDESDTRIWYSEGLYRVVPDAPGATVEIYELPIGVKIAAYVAVMRALVAAHEHCLVYPVENRSNRDTVSVRLKFSTWPVPGVADGDATLNMLRLRQKDTLFNMDHMWLRANEPVSVQKRARLTSISDVTIRAKTCNSLADLSSCISGNAYGAYQTAWNAREAVMGAAAAPGAAPAPGPLAAAAAVVVARRNEMIDAFRATRIGCAFAIQEEEIAAELGRTVPLNMVRARSRLGLFDSWFTEVADALGAVPGNAAWDRWRWKVAEFIHYGPHEFPELFAEDGAAAGYPGLLPGAPPPPLPPPPPPRWCCGVGKS